MPDARDLVTVFRGTQAQAVVLQTALGSRGLHPFLKDEVIKSIDPLVTGGNVFDVELQVPAAEVAEAREALSELRESGEGGSGEEAADPKLEALGRRIRWSTAAFFLIALPSIFFLPALALVTFAAYCLLAVHYLVQVGKASIRPSFHGINLSCMALVGVFSVVYAIAYIKAH